MANKKKSKKSIFKRRPVPLALLCVYEIILVGLALLVYAYFHHVQPQTIHTVNVVSSRPGNAVSAQTAPAQTAVPTLAEPFLTAEPAESAAVEATPTPAPTAEPTATPEPVVTPEPTVTPKPTATPDPPGYFGTKFADKFTDGDVVFTDHSYQSKNVNIQISTTKIGGANVHVADIYIRDISSFQAGLAKDRIYKNAREDAKDIARRTGALVSITGDFYSMRSASVVMRNGVLYRDKKDAEQDLCVLYWDGSIETLPAEGFDVYREVDRGAYQIWSFGPMLLDENSQPLSTFNHDLYVVNNGLTRKKPRTGLGYYEPGHYCFVTVDGGSTDSHGMSMASFSKLMNYLGCAKAYNLDGGESAQMYVGTKCYNVPEGGGRKLSDMLIIVEPAAGGEERVQ